MKRGVVTRALGDLTDLLPTLAEFAGATLPEGSPLRRQKPRPRAPRRDREAARLDLQPLDDGRVLRDSRWLLEIAAGGTRREKFFDCGDRRDGVGPTRT